MEPISERAREALEDHRARTGFGPGRKQAVRARLEASIAGGVAEDFMAELDQAAAEEGTGVSHHTAASRRARIGGMLALALAAGLAGVWWMAGDRAHEQEAAPRPEAAYDGEAAPAREVAEPGSRRLRGGADAAASDASPESAPFEPETAPEPEPDPGPASKAARARSRPAVDEREATAPGTPDEPAAASTLAAELVLLREARGALANQDPLRALARLDQHRKRFAHGQLEPERAALRVEVLCALDSERGERARESFLARYGASGHAKRVRALTCKSAD